MSDTVHLSTEALALHEPRSLFRLAPQSVSVRDELQDRPLRISPDGFHVRAGQRLVIQIVPQPADEMGEIQSISPPSGDHLYPEEQVGVSLSADGNKEYTAHVVPRLRWPIPTRTTLHITLHHNHWGDYTHRLPFLIFPSWWNQVLWVFTALFLPVLMTRLTTLWVGGEQARSLKDVLPNLMNEGALAECLGLTVCVLVLLRMLGWSIRLFTR